MNKKSVTITKTWEELAIMRDNDLGYYWTPGAHDPYLNSQPSFSLDTGVASYLDFVEAEGFDALSEDEDGLFYTLAIEYPFDEE